jgi:hypothetical protein
MVYEATVTIVIDREEGILEFVGQTPEEVAAIMELERLIVLKGGKGNYLQHLGTSVGPDSEREVGPRTVKSTTYSSRYRIRSE